MKKMRGIVFGFEGFFCFFSFLLFFLFFFFKPAGHKMIKHLECIVELLKRPSVPEGKPKRSRNIASCCNQNGRRYIFNLYNITSFISGININRRLTADVFISLNFCIYILAVNHATLQSCNQFYTYHISFQFVSAYFIADGQSIGFVMRKQIGNSFSSSLNG